MKSNLQKLLENDPIQSTIDWHGLTLAIEFPKGSVREYKSNNFRKVMPASYGYVMGTNDYDGEEIDVYVGDNLEAPTVYKLRQLSWEEDYTVDETKWMIGFSSKDEAIRIYIEATKPSMFGGIIEELTVDEFVLKMNAEVKSVEIESERCGTYR